MSTDNLQQYKKKKAEEFIKRWKERALHLGYKNENLGTLLSFLDTVIEESYIKGLERGTVEMEVIAKTLDASRVVGFAKKIRKRIVTVLTEASNNTNY